MSEWKVTASHRSRAAVIYVRQSTLVQVERNRESTARGGKGRKRWSNRWKAALNAFGITFDGRLSAGRK
jgi:hypothetical protein